MRATRGAAIGVIVLVAAWAAGCLLPAGHVDIEAVRGCQLAGDGPGLGALACGRSAEALPAAAVWSPASCMNAVMTVVANRGRRQIARWRGEVKWSGVLPADGRYTGAVTRGGAIAWDGESPQGIRVETDAFGAGGVPLRRWLVTRARGATRVAVFVSPGYGEDAGRRAGAGESDRAGDSSGGRGRNAPGRDGRGTQAIGTRGGSPRGGESPSWSQPSDAEVARRGGRTPEPGGTAGGSPAGAGQPGDHGLSVGRGRVISVPQSIAPALEVAVILSEAGVSATALVRKWLQRSMRGLAERQLRRELGQEAAKQAERAVDKARNRLSRSVAYRRLPAAEQQQILDVIDDAARREYLNRVEDGIARKIADYEESLARSRPRTGVERHVERGLRENLEAARRVQRAARQARDDLGPAPAPIRASSSATGRAPRIFTSTDPLVGDVATRIEALAPGRVAGVNRVVTDPVTGRAITDLDIELTNAIIQVKSGRRLAGGVAQVRQSAVATGKRAVLYGPNLLPRAIREAQREGVEVFTSFDALKRGLGL